MHLSASSLKIVLIEMETAEIEKHGCGLISSHDIPIPSFLQAKRHQEHLFFKGTQKTYWFGYEISLNG